MRPTRPFIAALKMVQTALPRSLQLPIYLQHMGIVSEDWPILPSGDPNPIVRNGNRTTQFIDATNRFKQTCKLSWDWKWPIIRLVAPSNWESTISINGCRCTLEKPEVNGVIQLKNLIPQCLGSKLHSEFYSSFVLATLWHENAREFIVNFNNIEQNSLH
jgi:hypothetical protein